jgi:tetratricopeptide (TPR) repeat protein
METPGHYTNLGKEALGRGDYEAAIENYNQALKLDPHDARAYNYLAYACIEEGRWDDANTALKTALVYDPNYALAHYNLALVQWNLGTRYPALKSLKHAFALDASLEQKVIVDDHFKDFTASPLFTRYQAVPFEQMPENDTLGQKPYTPPPFTVNWDWVGKYSLDLGSVVYISETMAENRNLPLMIGSDACVVFGVTGFVCDRNNFNHDSDHFNPYYVSFGMGFATLMLYPAYGTAYGFLSGDDGMGERGLVGLGADGVILLSGLVLWPNGPNLVSELTPQVTPHSVQLAWHEEF